MKRTIPEQIERSRIAGPPGEFAGGFQPKFGEQRLRLVVSNGGGWDHVSVSLQHRCPTWAEMCWVKDQLFEADECVMQLHPPKSDYVNYHPFCLHLWRPQTDAEIADIRCHWVCSGEEWPYGDLKSPGAIPRPDAVMVGPKARTA